MVPTTWAGNAVPALSRVAARAKVGPAGLLRLGIALFFLVPLSSAGDLDRVPLFVPAALAVLVALSARHPALGLVILSALIPVSGWMGQGLEQPALRMAETLVLAVLAGALLRLGFDSRRGGAGDSALPKGVWPFACLLSAAAAASSVLEWRVSQIGVPLTFSAVADFVRSLSTTYLYRVPAPAPGLVDAALLIEGAALLLVILECSHRHPDLPRRLAIASLAGAACVAIVNLSTIVADVLAAGEPIEELIWHFGGVGRRPGHVADVNAAGSYFLMVALTGIGLTFAGGRRLVYGGALLTLAAGTAFWLAGSRAALAAALIVCVGALTWWGWKLKPTRRRRAILGAAVVITVVLPIAVLWAYPGREGVDGALTSARIRIDFVATSLRMWATDPLFGVGAGRYYGMSERFMGPFIQDLWRENAHNNFLQIGAELGVVGLAGFVGLLIAGARPVRDVLRARAGPPEALLVGASAGVAAYLVTCLAGHPLLTPETAYPFWIVTALAVALARQRSAPSTVSARRYAVTAVAIGLFFVGTLPSRIDAVVRDAAARQDARFGAFEWETEPDEGRRFRWIGPRAAFFVPGSEDVLRLPLRALHAGRGRPVTVDVAVGGQRIARVPFFNDRWIEVPLRLPVSGGWYGMHRVALVVDSPWLPGERQNGDARTLGVMVGEIAPAASRQQ